jgi:hypothetical protein
MGGGGAQWGTRGATAAMRRPLALDINYLEITPANKAA